MSESLPVTIEFTCLAAPVQAEGTVAGRAYYFRARGEEWALVVSFWHRVRRSLRRKLLAPDEARSLIQECARAYINERVI